MTPTPPDAQAPGSEATMPADLDDARRLIACLLREPVLSPGGYQMQSFGQVIPWHLCQWAQKHIAPDGHPLPPRPEPSDAGEIGAIHKIDYDDFEGTVQGSYVTREGKPGVVLQQLGTRVCHLYGRNRLEGLPPPTQPSPSVSEDDLMEIIDPGCTDMSDQFTNAASVKYFGEQARRQDTPRRKAKQILALFAAPRPSPEDIELIARAQYIRDHGMPAAGVMTELIDRLSSLSAKGEATENPRVTDNDAGEISVTHDGKELRGWSYAGDTQRREKMLQAREYIEGWCDGRETRA